MERVAALMIVLALLPFAGSVDGGSGVEVKKIAEGVSNPAIWNNTIAYVRDGTIRLYDGKEIDTGIKFSGTSYEDVNISTSIGYREQQKRDTRIR